MPDRLDPPFSAATPDPRKTDAGAGKSADDALDEDLEGDAACGEEALSQTLWRVFNLRFLRGALTAMIILAVVLYFCVGATALILRVAIMPRIDSFRPRIEAAASSALGAHVSIVALSAHWQGLSPDIEIFGLTVRDRDGTIALSVPHASAVVAWRSLLHFEPALVSLLVEHPDVLAIRHANGSFEIAGVPLKQGGDNKNQLAHWLLTQDTIVLRGGTLHWHDDTRHVPDLAVRHIKLAIFNFGHAHRMGLQADGDGTVLHGPIDFRANFRHGVLADPGVPEGWLGHAYLNAQELDLPTLASYIDLPIEAYTGRVSARMTLAFAQMKLQSVEGELTGNTLEVRANPQLAIIDAPALSAQVKLEHIDNVFELGLRNLSITLADEAPLPDGSPVDRLLTIGRLDATYRQPLPGHGQAFSIGGDLIDVGLLANFSRKLPLPRTLVEQLSQFDPRGVLRNYLVSWERAPLDTAVSVKPDAASTAVSAAASTAGVAIGNAPIVHYRLKADLDNLSVAAQPAPASAASGHIRIGLPGFENLSGHIDTTERHGALTLASQQAAVTIDGLLDQPRVEFDRLGGHLIWDREPDGAQRKFEIRSSDLTFSNADMTAVTNVDYRNDGNGPGSLDLTSHFDRFNLASVARYLPSSLDPNLRAYLAHALRAGTAENAVIAVQGRLADFPFDKENKPGTFHISAPFHDGSFDPTPVPPQMMSNGRAQQWPVVDQISGRFDLDRQQLSFLVDHGSYRKMTLGQVQGRIADLSTHDDDFVIEGNASGPLPDLLDYIAASPVAVWTGHVLDTLEARGPATLALKLGLPRKENGKTTLSGTVDLQNDVLAYPGLPALSQAAGDVQFTERSATLQRVSGQFLGGTLNAQGGINPDGTVATTVSGHLDAGALRNQADAGIWANLAQRVSGGASYSVSMRANHPGAPEVTGSIDLTDVALALPAPLGKAAGIPAPLRFEIHPSGNAGAPITAEPAVIHAENHAARRTHRSGNDVGETAAEHDGERPEAVEASGTAEIDAQYGPISLAYLVRPGGSGVDGMPSWGQPQVVRGAIGINHPAELPARGVSANLTLDQLDEDAWRGALAQIDPAGTAARGDGSGNAARDKAEDKAENKADDAASDRWQTFWPTQFSAHIGTLTLLARTWTHVAVDGTHGNGIWQGDISADQVNGHLAWHPRSALSTAGEIDARLGKLTIPDAHASDPLVQDAHGEPQDVPALDLAIDDFTVGTHALGSFELQARNLLRDGDRVWQIERLKVSNPAAKLSATGSWRVAATQSSSDGNAGPPPAPPTSGDIAASPALPGPDPRRTELDFTLDVSDAGALLSRLGLPRTLQQGSGTLGGHIGWHGGPDKIDLPTLNGSVKLDLRHGQILKVDPGMSKLLGVLSLQSLVRFITLDFRGVTGSGLAFDAITASSKITQGVARTDDFKLSSPEAHVSMKGIADIPHETQDLRVMVVPTLSASSAALAATAINPLLGLSSFFAQLVLSDPLSKAFTVEYAVTGSWASPDIRQLKGSDSHAPLDNPADVPVPGDADAHAS
jgi:uncharacterized protein YhdP